MNPLSSLASLVLLWGCVNGHGQLISPPHRGYMHKAGFKQIPINYDANGLNGGGLSETSKGKHGVCGDPHAAAVPRPHETGGKYGKFPELGKNAIGGCFKPGSVIPVKTLLTANHLGFFRYQLCHLKGKNDRETEECFTTLKLADGSERVPVPAGKNDYDSQIQLPNGVVCDGDSHCVLRWHYRGGNNWGGETAAQEEFWNCADIYISNNCEGGGDSPSPSTPSPSTSSPSSEPSRSPSSTPSYTPSHSRTQSPSRSPSYSPSRAPSPAPSRHDNSTYTPSPSPTEGGADADVSKSPAYGTPAPSPLPSIAPKPSSSPSGDKPRPHCKPKNRRRRRMSAE